MISVSVELLWSLFFLKKVEVKIDGFMRFIFMGVSLKLFVLSLFLVVFVVVMSDKVLVSDFCNNFRKLLLINEVFEIIVFSLLVKIKFEVVLKNDFCVNFKYCFLVFDVNKLLEVVDEFKIVFGSLCRIKI